MTFKAVGLAVHCRRSNLQQATRVCRWLFLLLMFAGGCGEGEVENKDSAVSFEDGLKAYEAGQYESAVQSFSSAMDSGGLNPDQYSEAILNRAIAYARLGKYDLAHRDLDMAEMAPDLGPVYAARSYVFSKEGKSTESKAAMRQARKEDRKIKPIKD